MKTAKKGFTLIELMVVIVIIGILAAVAIPKLFGMTAKAKASELAPAGGTWVKLQQAFYLDADEYGSFDYIGYTPPSPTNPVFDYDGTPKTAPIPNSPATSASWTATSRMDLNDCEEGSVWQLEISYEESNHSDVVKYISPNKDKSEENDAQTNYQVLDECDGLTPNFKKLGTAKEIKNDDK